MTRLGLCCTSPTMWASTRRSTSLKPAVALLLAVFVTLPSGSPARAEGAALETRDDYRALVKQAVREFEASNWPEAFALFKRAHELEPSARTLRGIGLAAYEMRDYVQSIGYLQTALEDQRRPLSPAQRKVIDDHCTPEWAQKIATPWADMESSGRDKIKVDENDRLRNCERVR